ncbi:MAG: ATP-binding protein [Ruminococcus sp.]|uniref:ATP-binding protein n=1 Tax=Ruminococcus sp. TaxID=41978 RepID=UPI0025E9BA41|nr:ATP-binding protein [Ruminococcus sp.]MCR5540164.1 ATP-binding protein [Ruminococcus sp.]
MMIERRKYLDKLIRKKENGLVKVITGIRRCGKSYLLFEIYHKYLNSIGVDDGHIIELALDDDVNIRYRNPLELGEYIRSLMTDKEKMYYIFLDEIQKVAEIPNPYLPESDEKIGFVDVVLGLMKIKNADIYVTGSNSKMLSSDILTEFRGRGDEIKINPLSFSEFYTAFEGDKRDAWREYFTYGGMPLVLMQHTHEDKSKYLSDLFSKIYLDDIMNRNNIGHDKSVLEDLLNIISSSVGSLTNPSKLSKTFKSIKNISVSDDTIAKYLDYFIDAFMVYKAQRYDVKGRKYIGSPMKYYFSDIGLRNARLNFRQQEENHIMENIIYNELLYREFDVDVGVVEYNYKDSEGKKIRTNLEIDFVANKGSERYYIQSALTISAEEKRQQEINSLRRVKDSFKKIVVVKDDIIPWYDENGIYYVGIEKFLLEENER